MQTTNEEIKIVLKSILEKATGKVPFTSFSIVPSSSAMIVDRSVGHDEKFILDDGRGGGIYDLVWHIFYKG